jgi:hypothetical protein
MGQLDRSSQQAAPTGLSPSTREKGEQALGALKGTAQQIKRAERLLRRVVTAPNVTVAHDRVQELRRLKLDENLTGPVLGPISEIIEDVAADFRLYLAEYGSRLHDACSDLGWVVGGHYPEFWVNHTLRVFIDDQRTRAQVQGKRLRGDISVEAVVTALQEEVQRLTGGTFDADAFLCRLSVAYEAALADRQPRLEPGQYVALGDVYQELRRVMAERPADTGYPEDRFAADLSRLLQSGRLRMPDGRTLELAPARGKGRVFLYDPQVGRARYLGLIRFQRGGT